MDTILEDGAAMSEVGSERLLLSFTGPPPDAADPEAVASLGIFTKQPQIVNDYPCYILEERADVMLWCDPSKYWVVGYKDRLGTDRCIVYYTQEDVPLTDSLTGTWRIMHGTNEDWLDTDAKVTIPPPPATPRAFVAHAAAAAAADDTADVASADASIADASTVDAITDDAIIAVATTTTDASTAAAATADATTTGASTATPIVVDDDIASIGTRTREERDVEDIKRIIDLEPDQVRTHAQTPLDTRVAEARATFDATIAERIEALTLAAFKEYAADKIDEDELKRRKKAARGWASAEHLPLATLDAAYGSYMAATGARVAAERALESAIKVEGAATERVEEALRAIEEAPQRGAGSSSARSWTRVCGSESTVAS